MRYNKLDTRQQNRSLNEGLFSRKKEKEEQEDWVEILFDELEKHYNGNPTKMVYFLEDQLLNSYGYELYKINVGYERYDKDEFYMGKLVDYFRDRGMSDKSIALYLERQLYIDGEMGQELCYDMYNDLFEYGWPKFPDKVYDIETKNRKKRLKELGRKRWNELKAAKKS